MQQYIGIDPGQDGAIAVVGEDGNLLCWFPMPTWTLGSAKKTRREIAVNVLRKLLIANRPNCAFVERAHSMPKQGVASTFSFGVSYGILLGVLSGLEIPYATVTPQAWQKIMLASVPHDGETTKDAAAMVCERLWPDKSFLATDRSRKPHKGACDIGLGADCAPGAGLGTVCGLVTGGAGLPLPGAGASAKRSASSSSGAN